MPDINTLREALFDTLQGLKNKSVDIEHADAINRTAQTIINTAKVEVDFIKASGSNVDSSFIRSSTNPALPGQGQTSMTGTGTKQIHAVPGATVTQHRIR